MKIDKTPSWIHCIYNESKAQVSYNLVECLVEIQKSDKVIGKLVPIVHISDTVNTRNSWTEKYKSYKGKTTSIEIKARLVRH